MRDTGEACGGLQAITPVLPRLLLLLFYCHSLIPAGKCQAMNAHIGLEFMDWNPVLAADGGLYWTLQVLLLSARSCAFTGTYTVMKTGVRPFMALLGSVKQFGM